jgi:hypothetical protein
MFSVETKPKSGIFDLAKESARGKVSWSQMIKDAFAGWRSVA